jgi:5'-3' exoribonuclease 1
VTVL